MPRWFTSRRQVGLIAILGLGLTLRLAIAWTDLPALVGKALPDDAFYYFTIVEKALAGEGVTFDGLAPTNGFHPLWALLLAPIFALSPTRVAGLHGALTMAALFDTATIYLAFRAGRRLTGNERAGLWAAGLYGLNPRVLLESMNGLETAVSTFCFALFAMQYLRLIAPTTAQYDADAHARNGADSFIRGGIRGWLALGALAGLAVWGRTDALLIVVVVGLDLSIRLIDRAMSRTKSRSAASSDAERVAPEATFASEDAHSAGMGKRLVGVLAPLSAAGVSLLVVIAPWLIWNQITFGTPLQSSGVAVPYVVRAYLFELSAATGFLRLAGPPLYLASILLQTLLEYAPLPLAGLLAYLLWRVAGRRRMSRSKRDLPLPWQTDDRQRMPRGMRDIQLPWQAGDRRQMSRSESNLRLGWRNWAAPLLGSGLVLAAHAFGRFFLRGWYFIPLVFALSVLAGATLAHLGATLAGPPRARRGYEIGVGLVIALVLVAGGARLWRAGNYPWQAAMLDAARWADSKTEPDATIGAFNAGIMGWFSGRRTLNLDGVVGESAFAAIRSRGLLAFVRQHGVDYVVDWRSSVEETYAPFFETGYLGALEPIEGFPAPAGAGDVWDELIAYRVKP